MSRSRATYHHGDLKRALVDAALEVVESEGPEAVSFRRLAEAVRVSHAAPLAHFPDRLSLDAAVAVRGFQQLKSLLTTGVKALFAPEPRVDHPVAQARFLTFRPSAPGASGLQSPNPPSPASIPPAPAAAPPSLPVSQRLVGAALAYLQFALEHPGLYRVMYAPELSERLRDEEPGGAPESPFQNLIREKTAVVDTFVELVREGQQRGEIRRETSPDQVARLFTALAEGLAQQFIAEKLGTRTSRLEDAERMFELLLDAVLARSS